MKQRLNVRLSNEDDSLTRLGIVVCGSMWVLLIVAMVWLLFVMRTPMP